MLFLWVLVGGYLVGSVPSGYIVAKIKGTDIRQYGSGNIGTTNVWRTLGPLPGLITLFADITKGAVAVLPGYYLDNLELGLLGGVASIAGHSWPLFLRFKGGKIIATSLGVLLAISYQTALLAVAVWLITVAVSRYVSLGSIVAAISVPVWMILLDVETLHLAFGSAAAIFAVFKHRSNIRRLLQGKEFKITRGKRV